MMTFLMHLTAWHWLGLAVLLLVVEVTVGTEVLLWLGLSALITALLTASIEGLSWAYQWTLFGSLSVAVSALWWRFRSKRTDRPFLNRRGDSYIGRTFSLKTEISDGYGSIQVEGVMWRVASEKDAPKGSAVRVTSADGNILRVAVVASEEATD